MQPSVDVTYGRLRGSPPTTRDDDDQCRALREVTEQARDRLDDVVLEVLSATQDGKGATAAGLVRAARANDAEVPLCRCGGDPGTSSETPRRAPRCPARDYGTLTHRRPPAERREGRR